MTDHRFPTALQIVLSIALAEHEDLRCTSKLLAESLDVNSSLIRNFLIRLNRGGVTTTTLGKEGGIKLARSSNLISLKDIYIAVIEKKKIIPRRENLKARCRITAVFNTFYEPIAVDAEAAFLNALAQKTVSACLKEILNIEKKNKKSQTHRI